MTTEGSPSGRSAEDNDLRPVTDGVGAEITSRLLAAFKASVVRCDRTDVDALAEGSIDDALVYIDHAPEMLALAQDARRACRTFKRAFRAPARQGVPRAVVMDRARAKLHLALSYLQGVSWAHQPVRSRGTYWEMGNQRWVGKERPRPKKTEGRRR